MFFEDDHTTSDEHAVATDSVPDASPTADGSVRSKHDDLVPEPKTADELVDALSRVTSLEDMITTLENYNGEIPIPVSQMTIEGADTKKELLGELYKIKSNEVYLFEIIRQDVARIVGLGNGEKANVILRRLAALILLPMFLKRSQEIYENPAKADDPTLNTVYGKIGSWYKVRVLWNKRKEHLKPGQEVKDLLATGQGELALFAEHELKRIATERAKSRSSVGERQLEITNAKWLMSVAKINSEELIKVWNQPLLDAQIAAFQNPSPSN